MFCCGVALCPNLVWAESANERTLAEALFREGRELMAAGDFAEACPKFAESQRLDPGGGTLLNLAVCHEKQGKLATAWAEFQEALTQARSDAREDRVVLAQERIQVLEPQLARVTVSVEASSIEGLSVTVNGTPLGAPAWGVPMPVDAGDVRVLASAKGREPFEKLVSIADGEEIEVTVPMLTEAESASDQAEKGVRGSSERSNTSAYVFGGVGLAALGVGSYFGIRALQEHGRAEDSGCDSQCTTRAGRRAEENAVFNGWLSTVGIGAGLAAVGVAWYLYEAPASSDLPDRDRASVRIMPVAGPRTAGIDLLWVY